MHWGKAPRSRAVNNSWPELPAAAAAGGTAFEVIVGLETVNSAFISMMCQERHTLDRRTNSQDKEPYPRTTVPKWQYVYPQGNMLGVQGYAKNHQ